MIEYRIRKVTRYAVTRFEDSGRKCSLETIGIFDNETYADRTISAFLALEPNAITIKDDDALYDQVVADDDMVKSGLNNPFA